MDNNTDQPLFACHSKHSSFKLLQVEYTLGRRFDCWNQKL